MADIHYLITRSRNDTKAINSGSTDASAGNLIGGRQFGHRTAYHPAAESIRYDKRRAELDAQYIEISTEVLMIMMRQMRVAADELSVTIAMIRFLPKEQQHSSNVSHELYELFAELFKGDGLYQTDVTRYAKLIIEIEDRLEHAQQYVVDHSLV